MIKLSIYLTDGTPIIETLDNDSYSLTPIGLQLNSAKGFTKMIPYTSIRYWVAEESKVITPGGGGKLEVV